MLTSWVLCANIAPIANKDAYVGTWNSSWRAPKFLVDSLEGPSMRQCGSNWNLEPLPSSQHLEGYRGVLELRMGRGRIDKLIHSHGLAWNHTKWLELNLGPFGVGTATGEFGLTLTHHTPGLGVSHHLTSYSILCDSSRGWHPNGLFVPGLSRGSPEIAQLWTPATLKPHNFWRRPPIEFPSEAKL
jgi:hypothetical protein